MPIFDQGYQHWQGKLSGHAWRWLTIARQGSRTQFKNRWVRMVILLSLIPALILATFMIFWGLLEQEANAGFLEALVRMFGLPQAIRNAPKEFRNPVWTVAYEHFFRVELYISLGLVLLVALLLLVVAYQYWEAVAANGHLVNMSFNVWRGVWPLQVPVGIALLLTGWQKHTIRGYYSPNAKDNFEFQRVIRIARRRKRP